nr:hypothetical protein CFP56_20893 [Quercus suber]
MRDMAVPSATLTRSGWRDPTDHTGQGDAVDDDNGSGLCMPHGSRRRECWFCVTFEPEVHTSSSPQD